ncbi:TPA: hypothetical protein ON570_004088 [Citrobacter werkmanii]|nr:hypothetical protein [Citrobacter werkmanii]
MSWIDVVMLNKMSVAIYSEIWARQTALEHIYHHNNCLFRYYSFHEKAFFCESTNCKPDIVILDIPPRNNVNLILRIRQKTPSTYIFFTQHRFLFSDRVVAEFFGGIWLLEYDSIMTGKTGFLLSRPQTSPVFSGVYTSIRVTDGCRDDEYILDELNIFLRRRFSSVVSPRVADIVLRWLVIGLPVVEVCRLTGLKAKTIYHYREMTMKRLRIRHYSRDFIASLIIS